MHHFTHVLEQKDFFFYQIRTKEMSKIALSKLAIMIKAFKQAFEVADKLIDLN